MKVHLFNPENDLALAADTAHFTPPKAARALHAAGALLPLWWADEGDVVIAPDDMVAEAYRLCRRYGLRGSVARGLDPSIPCCTLPWGWSTDARRQLIDAGVGKEFLPTDSQLARHRMLSHRRISAKLLELIGEKPELIPTEARTLQEAMDAIGRYDGDAYIKLPWSGSGRGVFRTKGMPEGKLKDYITGFIRRQGSLMVEKTREKEKDFALLFEATETGVGFRGVSSFITDPRGAYGGNLVAPQADIIREAGVDPLFMAPTLERALSRIIGTDYRGWLGVDMMTERVGGRLEIVPCVEVNLRMTMGVAALLIREKLPDGAPKALLSLKNGGLEFQQ